MHVFMCWYCGGWKNACIHVLVLGGMEEERVELWKMFASDHKKIKLTYEKIFERAVR